jgi:hypothetical protein
MKKKKEEIMCTTVVHMVQGGGCRVWGCRVKGVEFRLYGVDCRVWGEKCRVWDLGCWVKGVWCRVAGVRCGMWGLHRVNGLG